MFTLKLYRYRPESGDGNYITTRIVAVDHVEAMEITKELIQLRAFHGRPPSGLDYATFYIGRRGADMSAIDDDNHWEWGLLENAAGKTTQHFRPYNYSTGRG